MSRTVTEKEVMISCANDSPIQASHRPDVDVLFTAMPSGNAARVLHLIADPPDGISTERRFERLDDRYWCGHVKTCNNKGVERERVRVGLELGVETGIHLCDIPGINCWSAAPLEGRRGIFIPIGSMVPTQRLANIANNLVACYVVRRKEKDPLGTSRESTSPRPNKRGSLYRILRHLRHVNQATRNA